MCVHFDSVVYYYERSPWLVLKGSTLAHQIRECPCHRDAGKGIANTITAYNQYRSTQLPTNPSAPEGTVRPIRTATAALRALRRLHFR